MSSSSNKSYIVRVEEDPENPDELILPIPDEVMQDAGWKIGDSIMFDKNPDDSTGESFIMTKAPKMKIVLVDAIQTFRMRYAVEVPEDAPEEWALDTVVCNEAKEFSQESLGETIASHRVVDQVEFLNQYRKDNTYSAGWTDDVCFRNGLTKWGEKVNIE